MVGVDELLAARVPSGLGGRVGSDDTVSSGAPTAPGDPFVPSDAFGLDDDFRLPDDFRLDSDDPSLVYRRTPSVEGSGIERVRAAARRADLEVYFVPLMRRVGQVGDAVRDEGLAQALAERDIQVLGPDYWLLPNRFFSDPMHLNREGARCYSEPLWELVGPVLTTGDHGAFSPEQCQDGEGNQRAESHCRKNIRSNGRVFCEQFSDCWMHDRQNTPPSAQAHHPTPLSAPIPTQPSQAKYPAASA